MAAPDQDRYQVPPDYEAHLEEGLANLDTIPRDDNWENARRILEDPPSRAEVESLAAQAAEAQSMLDAFQSMRFEGRDSQESTVITLDASGNLVKMEFGVGAAGFGNQALSTAIMEAWNAAEEQRERAGRELAERAEKPGR